MRAKDPFPNFLIGRLWVLLLFDLDFGSPELLTGD